jgi:RNA polymerase sigma-70 factor (ECF subfamily)
MSHIDPERCYISEHAQDDQQDSAVTVTADDLDKNFARPAVDQAEFESLFHRYWPQVYAVLFGMVGERAEAEDLALEVFWRLYRQAPSLLPNGNVGGWLYRVASNLGLNALRSQKRRSVYEEQAGKYALENSRAPDPSREVERSEDQARVRAVLAQMKARDARLLILRHSGLSYAEVAGALDLATGSIGTLLTRAEKDFAERYRKLEGKRDASE